MNSCYACSVVEILELFNHPSEALKLALQRQVDLFNPNDYCYTVSAVTHVVSCHLSVGVYRYFPNPEIP